jgi:hypothetical protein
MAFTGPWEIPDFPAPKRSITTDFWQGNHGHPAIWSLKQPPLKSIDRYFGEFDRKMVLNGFIGGRNGSGWEVPWNRGSVQWQLRSSPRYNFPQVEPRPANTGTAVAFSLSRVNARARYPPTPEPILKSPPMQARSGNDRKEIIRPANTAR